MSFINRLMTWAETIALIIAGLLFIAAPIAFKAFIWAVVAKFVWSVF